jgi:hypothetical protein
MRDPFLNFYIWFGAHIRTGPKRTDKISRRNRKQLLRGRLIHAVLSLILQYPSAPLYIYVWLGRPHRIAHTQLWRIILCNLGCKLSPKSGSWVRSAAGGGRRAGCLPAPAPLAVSLSPLSALWPLRTSVTRSLFIVLFRCACHSVINSASLCLLREHDSMPDVARSYTRAKKYAAAAEMRGRPPVFDAQQNLYIYGTQKACSGVIDLSRLPLLLMQLRSLPKWQALGLINWLVSHGIMHILRRWGDGERERVNGQYGCWDWLKYYAMHIQLKTNWHLKGIYNLFLLFF